MYRASAMPSVGRVQPGNLLLPRSTEASLPPRGQIGDKAVHTGLSTSNLYEHWPCLGWIWVDWHVSLGLESLRMMLSVPYWGAPHSTKILPQTANGTSLNKQPFFPLYSFLTVTLTLAQKTKSHASGAHWLLQAAEGLGIQKHQTSMCSRLLIPLIEIDWSLVTQLHTGPERQHVSNDDLVLLKTNWSNMASSVSLKINPLPSLEPNQKIHTVTKQLGSNKSTW